MKKFLLLILITAGLQAHSQVYNNEWIDYSKTYYKFKVGATGLYRIAQPTLASLGIGSVPAEQFQLWRNGQQVPLYTTIATGTMGGSDYIEFWGQLNDGHPDSVLYRYPSSQLNKKYSLQTDTAAFFLTVNPAGGNLRLVNTANALPSPLAPEAFFIHTTGRYYRDKQNPGYAQVVGEYIYSSAYDIGEGFTSLDLTANGTRTEVFSNLFVYSGSGAPNTILKVNAAGNAWNQRHIEFSVNSTIVHDQAMDFFDYVRAQVVLPAALSGSGDKTIGIKNISAVGTDRLVIAQIELVYPREFNFGNADRFEFELPEAASGNYLEISNFNHGGVSPVLYDFTNGKRYVGDLSTPGLVRIALEPSATARKLLLISQQPSVPVAVTNFQTRNFTDYSLPANQGDFLIITHPKMSQGAGGSDPIQEYKNYRSSAAGGSHNVKVYLIDELVDQFGLGIKKHPLSVRNFIRWARALYSSPVKNVLLIGKGLTYQQYRFYESNPNVEGLAYVPTFGSPASDNLLAAEPGVDELPKVSIGRISAINAEEVATYLAKLVQYEAHQAVTSPLIADKAWEKNVVHVIGASDGALGTILTNNMNGYQSIIRDTFYGANVHTFSKLTSAPVEQNNSARMQQLFQEGIGLMTYFGHSSASTLEFNLDNPDQYNNPTKYPVTIVMGCNAGAFYNFNTLRFITKETLSEKFVLANQRGSIAFIASSHLGIVHYLDLLNTRTYRAASITHYGATLGEILRESFRQVFITTSPNDFYARLHVEQTTLHGDPAIKLDGSRDKPDYVIEEQLVKVTPTFISVAETHFNVQAKFINLGKAPDKDIVVEIKRTYPDMTTEVIRRDTIPGIRFIDSINYAIDIVPVRDKGLNRITICVDADNDAEEIYETNNCLTRDVFIFENEARPVFPYTYSIVSNPATKLIASTANPFASMQQYILEVDTTEFFNSPAKIIQNVNSAGGIVEFSPVIPYVDSTVYYWRVAPVPSGSGSYAWNKSSFVFLSATGPNASDPGFNQSHFYQHTKSNYQRMYLDSASREFKFSKVNHNLFLRMGTWVTSGATQQAALSVAIDGVVAIRLVCWFQSLVFNVFDPVSFRPWRNEVIRAATNFPNDLGDGKFRSHSPRNFSGVLIPYNFEYRYTNPVYRKNAMDFMKDSIPDGHYVVVRNFSLYQGSFPDTVSFPQVFIDKWKDDSTLYGSGNTLYHYLKNAGFTGIDSFYRTRPWGVVYKKNDPSFAPRWLVGDGVFDNPTLSVDCATIDTVGYITSPLFGPSRGWKHLKWRGSSEPNGDLATLDVIGVQLDGTENILFSNLTTAQQNMDVSSINAQTYPFVKLRMKTVDSINYTPYALRYWRITYDPAPEGAIAPNLFFAFRDSVEVGEPFLFKVAFKNISEVPFDSLKVKMVVTDRNNVPHIIPIPRRRPLLVNDTLQIGADINTTTISGLNTVYLEANPDNDQPEQYHFNNFAYRSLFIRPDSLHPLLDVTFDGIHILNRDIVSSKPDIVVKLTDESRWAILDDTALLTLYVRYPNQQLRRFYFSNTDTMQFIPAGTAPNPDNTATINFRPEFFEDGEYELIITGRDQSNNSAGNIEYRVIFEVINKPMISNMMNYPNPFTTSTAFVFYITGHEVPQNLKIEIMTITGKIVREITKDELGPLHIGRNITEFKWDGTDQYGQKLANGIYLYRVVTNLNGKALDKYKAPNDNTDKYFNKGYGKMYLMR